MALSKSQVPDTAQHYLVCGIEDCEKNCLFYCNPCHQPMCEQCRDKHQKSPDTKNHEVVPYRHRKNQLPVEKCRDHPTKDLDILCDECNVPLCSKCSTMTVHKGHSFTDLETIYTEKSVACRQRIQNIQAYFMPTAKHLQSELKLYATEITKIMDSIRTFMKDEANSLKTLVDEVTSDNIEQVNKMEGSILEMLHSQHETYQDYISYLEELVKKFHGYLSSTQLQNNPIIFPVTEHLTIRSIPDTTTPVPPVFTAGRYSKEDVAKILGRITVPKTKPKNRNFKAMEIASTHLKPTGKQMKEAREKSDVKQTMWLSSSVTKVREYGVPGVDRVDHISLSKSNSLWFSDYYSHIVQTDQKGNQLQKIQTKDGRYVGNLTVTQDGDLIYTDKHNKVINRITLNNTITEFIKTGDWTPLSIHSSHINGDMLLGMIKGGKGKVTRFKTGKEIQNIERDNKRQELYSYPHYITENINGDICTSDSIKQAVVVVNKSGQHKFSYTGQESEFYPRGVCTDRLGHILMCDIYSNTVHLLDQDGQFLCLLLKQQQGAWSPCSVCVDDDNNLIVGQWKTNTVTVYKYLK